MSGQVMDTKMYNSDGTIVEVAAYEIQAPDEYPEGYKYRFQYGTENGTILRFDNSHGVHDRHIGKEYVEETEFRGLREHLERFLDEVEQLRLNNVIDPENLDKDEIQEITRKENH